MNNLYGWAMSQKLPGNGFKWVEDLSKFSEYFGKAVMKKLVKDFFFEVDVQYIENLYNLHNDLPFLPETRKIEKIEKLVSNLNDKKEYVIRIRNLKEAFNHRFVLKKVHKVIKFNQEA